jgi:bifunctional non-homologous end joining protein LigD
MAPFYHWDVQTGEKSKCTLASLESDFVLDGELVALDSRGKPSYQLIQHSSSQPLPICCYALDLLNRNGELLVKLPVSRRRELLEDLLAARKDPLRLSPLLQASSGEVLEAVRKLGLEGVVGKRTDSQYEAGERTGAWIKLRASMEQEFVIGGYVPGARGFDALLLGVYENKELKFVARLVGFVEPHGKS